MSEKRRPPGDFDGDSIFSAVALTAAKKGNSKAIGVYTDGCVVWITYEELINSALILADTVAEQARSALLLHGGGAYETTLMLLVSSLLGSPLILCARDADASAIDSVIMGCEGIFTVSDSLSARNMDLSELSATTLCYKETTSARPRPSAGALISFLGAGRLDSYGEADLLHSAQHFALMSATCSGEVVLSDISPFSPEGVVCALLATLISGGTVLCVDNPEQLDACLRLAHPTRLFGNNAAERALDIVQKEERGALAMPVIFSPKRKDNIGLWIGRAALARKRRLYSGRLQRLGGRLRGVYVLGEERDIYDKFADLGIMTYSVLSTVGCPFVGLKSYFEDPSSWRLPKDLFADVCHVGRGGIGRITLSGLGPFIPAMPPVLLGSTPGRFRLDSTDGLSFVTDLRGYVLPNGNICLQNGTSRDFFRKSSCNSSKSVL